MTLDLAKIRKKARAAPSSQQAQDDPGPALPAEAPVSSPAYPLPDDPAPDFGAGEPCSVAALPPPPPEVRETSAPEAGGPAKVSGEKLLVFDLGEEKYAVPIHDIAQIIDVPPVTPIPNSPRFLSGIFSLRGKIVSVIDAAVRMGGVRSAGDTSKVIVLETGGDQFGLLVDRIDLVVDVDLSALEPPPEGFKPVAQEFVEGVFHHRDHAVAFLNLPLFLAFEV